MNRRIVGVEQAIEDIRSGKMVILVDDEQRENEGDLCCAAELVTPETINFMATYGRGLICLSLTEEKSTALQLLPMVHKNESPYQTAFTHSIDASKGVTTGISAHDRARTILAAVAKDAQPEDLTSPGHIFPLRARQGGVLIRPGQTEGSVDLAKLAGLDPSGVICEIMNDDGEMARMPELIEFSETHGINIVTVAALIQYRMTRENLIERTTDLQHLPRLRGNLQILTYCSPLTPDDVYVALIKGDIETDKEILVRIHRECFLGDFMGSLLCDCSQKLKRARELITSEGRGVLLYVRRKDGSIDFKNSPDGCGAKTHATGRQQATETLKFKREVLNCGVCAKILLDLGIRKVRSLTSNPDNNATFDIYGLELTERVPL